MYTLQQYDQSDVHYVLRKWNGQEVYVVEKRARVNEEEIVTKLSIDIFCTPLSLHPTHIYAT